MARTATPAKPERNAQSRPESPGPAPLEDVPPPGVEPAKTATIPPGTPPAKDRAAFGLSGRSLSFGMWLAGLAILGLLLVVLFTDYIV